MEGLPIKSPNELKGLTDVKISVLSIYWAEILEEIREIDWLEIDVYKPMVECCLPYSVQRELNKRTIDLGAFLNHQKEIACKELTFMPGGSQVLDYAFLKALVKQYSCQNYLEIGTYTGESINILTDCCEKLYSITVPVQEPWSMARTCKALNVPNYSERLTYSEKIKHFYADSRKFDFTKIEDEIDLYFIDGDNSYDGIYADTKNVFEVKKENAIVVLHDFRKIGFSI